MDFTFFPVPWDSVPEDRVSGWDDPQVVFAFTHTGAARVCWACMHAELLI